MLAEKILAGEELTYDELTTIYAIIWDDKRVKFVDDMDEGDFGQVIFEIDDTLYAIDWKIDDELAVTSQPYKVYKRTKLIEVPEYVKCDQCILT